MVELEGKERLITSCNNVVAEGMVLYTNSPKVRRHRRKIVELLLSQHDCLCATCQRSGNCSLQKIANDLNILEIPFHQTLEHQPWNKNFPLLRKSEKCIKCMRCVQICPKHARKLGTLVTLAIRQKLKKVCTDRKGAEFVL